MGERVNRRQFVVTGAAGLTGVMSGCSAISDWTEEQAQKQRKRIPRLCRSIVLGNYDSEPHVFHVLIERDGEIMRWWNSDQIPAQKGVNVDLGGWHWERGNYRISASYDDYPDWAMNDLSNRELEEDEACIWPYVSIGEDGNITVTTSHQGKNEYSTPTTTESS